MVIALLTEWSSIAHDKSENSPYTANRDGESTDSREGDTEGRGSAEPRHHIALAG